MNKYTIKAPIEVRSGTLEKNPEYIVKAYINANIPDNHGTFKFLDGSKKIMSSVFTRNCVDSLRRQAKAKKILVDSQHKNAARINVEHMMEQGKVDPKLKEGIMRQFKMTELPLFKLNDITTDTNNANRLIVDARLNPSYRLVNEEHKNHFDAVWNSIQDGYINQVSFDFAAKEITPENGIDYINDLDLFGISFTNGGALPENEVFEVAMRAAQDLTEETKMTEENNEKMKEMVTKVEDANKAAEESKQQLYKVEEQLKEKEMTEEKKEHKQTMESMQKEIEELKKTKETETTPTIDKTKEQPVVKTEEKTSTETQTPQMEEIKASDEVREMLWKRAKIMRQYPNHEDLFNLPARQANPDGDITLGMLLALQSEEPERMKEVIDSMTPDAKRELLKKDSFVDIEPRLRKI